MFSYFVHDGDIFIIALLMVNLIYRISCLMTFDLPPLLHPVDQNLNPTCSTGLLIYLSFWLALLGSLFKKKFFFCLRNIMNCAIM